MSALWVLVLLASTTLGQIIVKSTGPKLSDIDNFRYNVLQVIKDLDADLTETNDINHVPMTDMQLLQQYKQITKNLTKLEENIDQKSLSYLGMMLSYAQLETEVQNMNHFFEIFIRHQKEQVRVNHERAWKDVALYFLEENKNGVKQSLNNVHSYSLPHGESSIFLQALQDKSRTCELNQSQQQIIYQLYEMIAVAELKGFVMINYAWMLLRLYDKGNFTTEANLFNTLYNDRTIRKIEAAKAAMVEADRSLFKCDPKEWKEGENFVKLTKLLQGYIENEVNLNPERTCRENCRYYQVTEYHGCYMNQFCDKQPPCKGKVVQCTYVDSDMNICRSSSEDRRYDWIEYESGRILGNKGSCPARFNFKVDSWWRYLFWHCSYCFCLCDDNSPSSDRYFNLREVKSDIKNNKVVTGVRFVKEKQVIHIQIEQGQLLPRGVINKTSVEWLPVPGYSILDNEVQSGVDYHTMTWKERSIDLDDVVAPADHVVTGCRLRMVGSHLNLEVRATPFDFETGEVHPPVESVWLANDNTDGAYNSPRKEVYIPNPDVPIKRGPNMPTSNHDNFIQFKESSMTFDASQSTVPYIDGQPVQSNGFPVSGMGIYHKGTYNAGGFVALKLITFDFSPHMVAETPNIIA